MLLDMRHQRELGNSGQQGFGRKSNAAEVNDQPALRKQRRNVDPLRLNDGATAGEVGLRIFGKRGRVDAKAAGDRPKGGDDVVANRNPLRKIDEDLSCVRLAGARRAIEQGTIRRHPAIAGVWVEQRKGVDEVLVAGKELRKSIERRQALFAKGGVDLCERIVLPVRRRMEFVERRKLRRVVRRQREAASCHHQRYSVSCRQAGSRREVGDHQIRIDRAKEPIPCFQGFLHESRIGETCADKNIVQGCRRCRASRAGIGSRRTPVRHSVNLGDDVVQHRDRIEARHRGDEPDIAGAQAQSQPAKVHEVAGARAKLPGEQDRLHRPGCS